MFYICLFLFFYHFYFLYWNVNCCISTEVVLKLWVKYKYLFKTYTFVVWVFAPLLSGYSPHDVAGDRRSKYDNLFKTPPSYMSANYIVISPQHTRGWCCEEKRWRSTRSHLLLMETFIMDEWSVLVCCLWTFSNVSSTREGIYLDSHLFVSLSVWLGCLSVILLHIGGGEQRNCGGEHRKGFKPECPGTWQQGAACYFELQ